MHSDDTQPDLSVVDKTPLTPTVVTPNRSTRRIHANAPISPASPMATTPIYNKDSQADVNSSLRRRPAFTPKNSVRITNPVTALETRTTQSSELADELGLSPVIEERFIKRNYISSDDFGPRGNNNFIKYREKTTWLRKLRKKPWMVCANQVAKIAILLGFTYSFYIFHYVYHDFELKTTPEYKRIVDGFVPNGSNFERCNHINWTEITYDRVKKYRLENCDYMSSYPTVVRKFESPNNSDEFCVDRYEVYPCFNPKDARLKNISVELPKKGEQHCLGTPENPRMYSLETHPYKVPRIELSHLVGKTIPSSFFYSRCPICAVSTRLMKDTRDPTKCYHRVRQVRAASPKNLAECVEHIEVPCQLDHSPFLNLWGVSITEQLLGRTYYWDPEMVFEEDLLHPSNDSSKYPGGYSISQT